MHELISALIDQIVDLRLITEAYVRTQVELDGPIGGKHYVQRPDSPIDQAKKIQSASAAEGMEAWYERTMKGVN